MLAGVIGLPIGHSRSPKLHAHWLERYRITGYFVPVAILPERLETGLRALAELGFRGVNVTLPHKEAALALAATASDAARQIGAANTLTFNPDGSFRADNTDAYGFAENIRQTAPDWRAASGPALVLGAGGAARAVLHALIAEGAPQIRLANRNPARAEALAAHFGGKIRPVEWAKAEEAADGAVTLVNTTSLGMKGQPPLVLNLSRAAPDAIVNDIVYEPLVTPFLDSAARQGLRIVDGLGMLLHQAVPAFHAFFGQQPEVDERLRRDVLSE
jgi:shikimate dehydrogenase